MHTKDDNINGLSIFCKIQYNKSESLKVLIINNYILSKIDIEKEKKIKISLNDDKIYKYIEIDESKLMFTSEKYGITFIEIKENDEIKNFFELYMEKSVNKNELNNIYLKKAIYTISYTEKKI